MKLIEKSSAPREFTGRHMLMIMVAFFGVIISVNFTMAWLAGHSWTGLVVKNSYVASQGFNKKLRQARAQNSRGWRTRLSYEKGIFRFRLADRNSQPVDIASLALSVGRPATETEDRVIALRQMQQGTYTAEYRLGPGLWDVVIAGGQSGRPYRYEKRLTIGADGQAKP
jgi:nitrogen fixation protein FixH